METLDRHKDAFARLARGANPNAPYEKLYRCKLLKQHQNKRRVDVAPDDKRWPPMSNIPLRVGIPGAEVTLAPGHRLMLGWEDGLPDRPFVALWESGPQATTPLKVTFHSSIVELGGGALTPVTDGVVRAATPCQFTGAPHFVGGKTSLAVLAKEK